MSRLAPYRRVLAFGAHPDDLEVGAGGTLARLVTEGADVVMVVASIPNRFAERRAEAIAGARLLGARLVLPPGAAETRVDGSVQHDLVARFDHMIAEHAPDLVVMHGAHDAHQDHTIVHRAVMGALRRTRCDVLAYATRLPIGAAPPATTCVVDITATIDAKIAAIAAHATQFPAGFAEVRRDLARAAGVPHGLAYAEGFEALRVIL